MKNDTRLEYLNAIKCGVVALILTTLIGAFTSSFLIRVVSSVAMVNISDLIHILIWLMSKVSEFLSDVKLVVRLCENSITFLLAFIDIGLDFVIHSFTLVCLTTTLGLLAYIAFDVYYKFFDDSF